MKKLVIDESGNIRYAVAVNPNTSSEILKKLAKDKNDEVRKVAKNALQKRQEDSNEKT